jgi:delta8-fatty-acid desaturase
MALEHMKGKDATDAIIAFHPPEVLNKRMHAFCIGELAKNELPVSTISESWRKLESKMHEIGLFESKPSFWFLEVAKFCVLWAVMITLAVKGGDNLFMHLGSAISAAILWHQVAFMGHDGELSSIWLIDRWP